MLTIDENSVSHLRRSQRKLKSQVPFSPISSFDRFNTPPLKFSSSIDNFSLNQTPVSNSSNLSNKSLGSVTGSIFSVELANGSVKSSTTSNGVEWFQGLGGSVRASKVNNSSGLIGKENGGIDVDLVKTIKGYSRKRSRSCGLKAMGKVDEKEEMGVESSKDSITVSTSPTKQQRKKRRNVTSGSEDKSKSQHQKAVCGGGGGGGSGIRSLLSSIENISSTKTHSRRPKTRMTEVCFTEGQEVEVANMDEGFYGSWYRATIIGPSTEKGAYILEYHTLADETEPKPLRESVRVSQIRPRPPTVDVRSFEMNEVVDAYDNDGWWQGVVVKVLQDDRYIVCFTKFKMEMEFGKSDLRTCMEWIQGTWVRPQCKGMGKIDENDEMGIESSKKPMTVLTLPLEQRRKKRRNVTSGNEDKSKSQHQKAVYGGGGGLSSRLSSIENISSSKTHSRRPKKRMKEVRCFTEGQEVEVANIDEGFYGSWYSAIIIGPSTEKKGTYILEYHKLADETEPKPLRESVRASQIRPRPPTVDVRSFELNEVVDAYDNDGWWQGVVVKVLQDDRYVVRFTKFKMEMEFGKSDLRTCMEWIQGTWVRPQSKEILSGVKKSRKTTCKLSKSIDGVEGTKMPNSIDDKSRTNMFYGVDKENTQFRSNVSTDLIETPSVEATQSGNAECATSSMDNSKKIKAGKSKSLLSFPLLMPRDSGEKKSRKTNKQIEEIGYKNTSNQFKGDLDLQGWTTDQELALQRAYFSAKPSPHFWKKVSKMVPGKSAQECFDRIHADSITPPQHQPRSRAKKSISSPLGHFSLSGSKLLEPAEPDTKKPKTSRDKKYLAHKTVRHLLKKHNQADQDYQADVFSVLEPGMISSAQSPEAEPVSTPPRLLKKNGFFDECQERSSSHHKKPPLSRFRDSSRMALVSPPVLKPIKNIALHEKYIDQLHCREAKRMAEDRRNLSAKENKSNGNAQKMDVVKAAKNALISDARDMILQFQHLQENPTSDFKDDDDDYDRTSGEDGDDE